MASRSRTIFLTSLFTAAMLMVGLAVFAVLIPRQKITPTQAKTKQQIFLLFTPKAVADFQNPLASVKTIFDSIENLISSQAVLTLIFAVGSNDHILRYGSSARPEPLELLPPALSRQFPLTLTKQGNILRKVSLEPDGEFEISFPLRESVLISSFSAAEWSWSASGIRDLIVRFSLRNTATGETEALTYRVAGQEKRPGFDLWEDFLIEPPLQDGTTQKVTLAIAQDLFRKRTPDQNTHLVEGERWLLTNFVLSGSAAAVDFEALRITDGGVNWARTVYSDGGQIYPLAQHSQVYPQILRYEDIKKIVAAVKQEASRRGLKVRLLDALEASTEFSRQDWLYGLHPEALFIPARPALPSFNINALLEADHSSYASYPNGIPENTLSGDFLIQQARSYLSDLGFDGLYLMNAFGVKGQWYPQRAPGESNETAALLSFYQKLRRTLPDKYLLWMDSYYPRWVEEKHYNIPEDFYDLIDGLQISTFWQNDASEPEIRWNPEGMYGTMRETIASKLALKKQHPRLDVFWTFYARDPWYVFGYEDKTNTDWFQQNKKNLKGAVIYSINDAQGNINSLPQKIIETMK